MKVHDAKLKLFQATPTEFIAVRKSVAAELKAAGLKTEAGEVAKIAKPPITAWAVNQLWWKHEADFNALMTAAKAVRAGDMSEVRTHRKALAKLEEHATALLESVGNSAQESTLRRIETTLSAIAASGSFEPEEAGMLTDDREASGFSALGISSFQAPPPAPPPAPEKPHAPPVDLAKEREARAAAAAAAAAEKKEREEREARAAAALKEAKAVVTGARAEVTRLEKELDAAMATLNAAEEKLAELEAP